MGRISIENGRIRYFGNTAGYIAGKRAVVDPIFSSEKLQAFLNRQNDVEEVEWREGVYERLADGPLDSEAPIFKNVRIWQLRPEVEVSMKFISLNRMLERFGEPKQENYQVAFDGEMNTNNLEEIYNRFHTGHLPDGYRGHAIAVSDVIELYGEGGREFHYVDERGFQAVSFGEMYPVQEPVMEL